ncbi:SRPBCC family protein [Paraflavitalea pollutisoli]|uniref:SRPBCC family protein n=1 Tax=Paraflavitalea pollutisoli TaxID=3034143 RepID=UPI0023EE244D|nr:SRPBCC domain-containing protein [Paraflavitalea sp. H1-2-19X]
MQQGNDFTTSIQVFQSPLEAFKAINNVRGWWSQNIKGDTDKLQAEWFYRYKDMHVCRMKVTELVPGQRVVWQVVDNYFNFTEDQHEWQGDRIIFEIGSSNGKTDIQFTHEGLSPDNECYDACYAGWTKYVQGSLRKLIEEGKGEPNPPEPDVVVADMIEQFDLKG